MLIKTQSDAWSSFFSGSPETDGNEEWRKRCQTSHALCGTKSHKCNFTLLNHIKNVGCVYKVSAELHVNDQKDMNISKLFTKGVH